MRMCVCSKISITFLENWFNIKRRHRGSIICLIDLEMSLTGRSMTWERVVGPVQYVWCMYMDMNEDMLESFEP